MPVMAAKSFVTEASDEPSQSARNPEMLGTSHVLEQVILCDQVLDSSATAACCRWC